MAFTFVSDPSLSGFNSFTTVAFADDYMASKLDASWGLLTDDIKQNALIWASRQLSALEWKGVKTDKVQNLAFPRKYLFIDGGVSDEEFEELQFDWYTVPLFAQEATADLAGQLVQEDTTARSDNAEFKRVKIDVLELEMKDYAPTGWLTPSVSDLIWRYLAGSGRSGFNVPTKRVG